MNLMGLTKGLLADGDQRCPGGFRAWLAEVQAAQWEDAEDMLETYPKCWWLESDRYHFSLGTDDVGIRADVFFSAGIVMVHGIAPRIIRAVTPAHAARSSVPAA